MHWIYHKTLAAKIVDAVELVAHLAQGWVDSPAKVNDEPEQVEPVKKEKATKE
jgi:hypothetical protein